MGKSTMPTAGAKELAQLFSDFVVDMQGKRSPHTLKMYQIALQEFATYSQEKLKYRISTFDISSFSQENMYGFLRWLKEEKGNSDKTCNMRLSGITAFLKYASKAPEYRAYYLDIKCITRAKTLRMGKVVEPLSKKAVSALIKAPGTTTPTGLRYTTMMTMLYSMACRIDEILSIKVGDLKLDDIKPHVEVVGKGRKHRTLYIIKGTVAIIKRYLRSEHGEHADKDAYLFFSPIKGRYEKYSSRAVNKQLRIYAEIAKESCSEVPLNVHSHQFRHSMATHCLEDGMNVYMISKMLGHESVNTTMIYLGVTLGMTDNAIKKIESVAAMNIQPKWNNKSSLKQIFEISARH